MNVLFDLEGTLIDSKLLQINVLNKVFANFGVDTKNIDMISLIGPPLINTFSKYFGQNYAQNAMDYYMEVFNKIEIKDIFVNKEIEKVLPVLKEKGYHLVVTSLQVLEIVKRELCYLGIDKFIDSVVGDSKNNPFSSKIDLVNGAIKNLRLNKNETILIGDTNFDKESAQKNGIKFVGVQWGYGLKNENDCVKTSQELLNQIEKFL